MLSQCHSITKQQFVIDHESSPSADAEVRNHSRFCLREGRVDGILYKQTIQETIPMFKYSESELKPTKSMMDFHSRFRLGKCLGSGGDGDVYSEYVGTSNE